ncbi:hypothetical protein FLP41_03145 (plasmid) [Paracoccus marcusii]|uniref:hypothetical protein n=1 Tax=Paracoccus marcusii TaxID=59779 RepID=UPI002ED38013|nr:hypothetical protein FLP41_03145 [Paracoccus marcusii]
MDRDTCIDDIKLWAMRDDCYDLMRPAMTMSPRADKIGATVTTYEKENWSSMMLFNNVRCTALTRLRDHGLGLGRIAQVANG